MKGIRSGKVGKGVSHFARYSAAGLAMTGSRVADSLGGVSALIAGGQQFMHDRMLDQRAEPHGLEEGVKIGVKRMTSGVDEGFHSIVAEPKKGFFFCLL